MSSDRVEIVAHLRGFLRASTAPTALQAGAGRVSFEQVRPGYMWWLDLVTVGGPSIGGARVSLYRNIVAYDTLVGSVLLGASDPGAAFSTDGPPPRLHQGERLVVDVTGSAGAEIIAAVDYRLYELEERPWEPARTLGPVAVRIVGVEVHDDAEGAG